MQTSESGVHTPDHPVDQALTLQATLHLPWSHQGQAPDNSGLSLCPRARRNYPNWPILHVFPCLARTFPQRPQHRPLPSASWPTGASPRSPAPAPGHGVPLLEGTVINCLFSGSRFLICWPHVSPIFHSHGIRSLSRHMGTGIYNMKGMIPLISLSQEDGFRTLMGLGTQATLVAC